MNAPATAPSLRFPSIVLAAGALLFAWFSLAAISRDDPWYRNTDMNTQNLDDAMAINAGVAPVHIDQPGLVPKYLLALDYRARHAFGMLPAADLQQFAAAGDPLATLPRLVEAGRAHQRLLVLLVMLAGGLLVGRFTRSLPAAGLAILLLGSSTGLLFHGLLTRPELHCLGAGLLMLLCTWEAGEAPAGWQRRGWLFTAGLFAGLAVLSKLPGICYLPLAAAWCGVAALTGPERSGGQPASLSSGLLPAVSAAAALALLLRLAPQADAIGETPLFRLRLAAVLVALLPLLALANPRHMTGRFLLARIQELNLLAGGALATLPLGYLLLAVVMPGEAAATYFTRILRFALDPAPTLQVFADSPALLPVLQKYLAQDPVLLLLTPIAALALLLRRTIPVHRRAFVLLLVQAGLGLLVVLSHRHYTDHYPIFYQVPLLLAWAAGLGALAPDISTGSRWLWPAAGIVALGLLLCAPGWVRKTYAAYQDDAGLPVNELTLTLIYDHTAHTPEYLRVMRENFASRDEFRAALDRRLADPAQRR